MVEDFRELEEVDDSAVVALRLVKCLFSFGFSEMLVSGRLGDDDVAVAVAPVALTTSECFPMTLPDLTRD